MQSVDDDRDNASAARVVARTGIKQERGYLCYLGPDGNVWRTKLKRPDERKSRPEKVASPGVRRDDDRYLPASCARPPAPDRREVALREALRVAEMRQR